MAKPDFSIPRLALCILSAGCMETYQDIVMKSIARAVLVGSFIVAAQAAVADGTGWPDAVDDAGVHLPPNVTYASEHANDRVTSVGSTFPDAVDDAGVSVPSNVTYADLHSKDPVTTVSSAFPDSVDDDGVHLPARNTYADSHLGNPVAQSQPAQGADASGE